MKTRLTIFGILLFFVIVSLSFTATRAYFIDSATSSNNTFQTAEFFPKLENLFDSNPFTCSEGASNISIDRGDVKFIHNGSTFDIEIKIASAAANTAFDIWVNQDPGACPLGSPTAPAFMTTNEFGNAEATLTNQTFVGGATKFWISAVGGGQVLRSKAISF